MLLLINKPKGLTSHDVVDRVRKITHERRVGHAGTLDPNATGLLIVGVGRQSTKKLGEITKNTKKEYEAEIYLGEERSTDDTEGEIIFTNDQIKPTKDEIKTVLKGFIGKTDQIPPSYSAIKISGKKSYELARRGDKIAISPRRVNIYQIKNIKYKYPILKFDCLVSSGTYIRALARDIGKKLGSGAYLLNLKRTRVGQYKLMDAKSLEEIEKSKIKIENNFGDK